MQIQIIFASESHVPRFRAGVGTWRSEYMIPIRLPWRHRARPSATLHEIPSSLRRVGLQKPTRIYRWRSSPAPLCWLLHFLRRCLLPDPPRQGVSQNGAVIRQEGTAVLPLVQGFVVLNYFQFSSNIKAMKFGTNLRWVLVGHAETGRGHRKALPICLIGANDSLVPGRDEDGVRPNRNAEISLELYGVSEIRMAEAKWNKGFVGRSLGS